MKFGIDLDHVLFNNTIVHDVLKELNVKVDSLRWDFSNVPPEVKIKCFERFLDVENVCNLNPIRGTKKTIAALHKAGHELVCVTARPFEQFDRTQQMLESHFPQIEQLVVVGNNEMSISKLEAYKRYEFDVVVDDCVENIEDALKAGVEHIYLVANKLTIWNRHHTYADDDRVKIIEGLKDIDLFTT